MYDIYIFCLVTDIFRFEKLFLGNKFLQEENIRIIPIRKSKHAAGSLYNRFLESIPEDARWLCFVTDAVEFRQSPRELLQQASEDTLLGVFGARAVQNKDGAVIRECRGSITESAPGQLPNLFYNDLPVSDASQIVDTLDSRCLFIPASLVSAYALRFDAALERLYGEDFCLKAHGSFGVKSRVATLEIVLHEPLFYASEVLEADKTLGSGRYEAAGPKAGVHLLWGGNASHAGCIVSKKIRNDTAKTYSYRVDNTSYNLASVLAAKMLGEGSRILDAGCAVGDNGEFLKRQLSAELYGLDYSQASLELASAKNVYEDLHHVDLNAFTPGEFASYYRFFDSILLLDVLEHLYSPEEVLQKLSMFLKPSGSFIISLPNFAHLHPVLSLVNKEFTYREYGILDSTHIRFFTWKSLAASLATWGFRVEFCNAAFRSPNEAYSRAPVTVPFELTEELLQNRHSLALQYVCKIVPSEEGFAVLKTHNLSVLDASVHNNPEGWNAIAANLDLFRVKVARANGALHIHEERMQITRLFEEEKTVEAILLSGFYDEEWYKDTYSEVDFTAIHPLQHYLETGWKEGKSPSEAFDSPWCQEYLTALLPKTKSMCPLLFHLSYGINHNFPHNKKCSEISKTDLARYACHIIEQETQYADSFVQMEGLPYETVEGDPRIIAFYLPQFAPFPENDEWWGKGFTEWTNVTKNLPLYPGHYQPHLPYDLGFYDLRVKETCLRQEELASFYGIHGFCYHYYWFDGKKIMGDPIAEKLRDKTMSLPFCISWANEAWSANWDGSRNNLLVDQPQTIRTEALFYDILPFFQDERYIRVNGKPLFMMYRPTYFNTQTVKSFMDEFERLAKKNGFPGLHLVVGATQLPKEQLAPLATLGADAYVEFPPHRFAFMPKDSMRFCNPKAIGRCFDLSRTIAEYKKKSQEHTPTYRTVFPMWDNSARRAEKGAFIFEGATPETYFDWLRWCIQKNAREASGPDNRIVFVNAWNEWAEGAHLEPDRKYGYAFLEMTKKALYAARSGLYGDHDENCTTILPG